MKEVLDSEPFPKIQPKIYVHLKIRGREKAQNQKGTLYIAIHGLHFTI